MLRSLSHVGCRLSAAMLCLLTFATAVSADAKPVRRISFGLEVLPVLTKHGCATGACHGSPSGKGAFRLSLRGFDPELDELTVIREQFGRRANVSDPDRSLLLLKPTMEVSHAGGRRLRRTDAGYAILRSWIQQGCRTDAADSPTCLSIANAIKAVPSHSDSYYVLNWPTTAKSMEVLATFSDGSVRNITHLADFSSTNEDVATVDSTGMITLHDGGEATVLARYLNHVDTVRIAVRRNVEGFVWNDVDRHNFIDDMVFAKLRLLHVKPSSPATDAEFLRRVYLDTIGLLPTVEESRSFLNESKLARQQNPATGEHDIPKAVRVLRLRLIDSLLERHEFAEYQAQQWADLLRVKSSKLGAAGVQKFHQWLVSAVRSNVPYDEFARALVTARGSTFESPPAAYFRAATDPNSLAETTSQLFLGIRVQCARCHNHPFESWTQDHYFGMAAFFSRVRVKDGGLPGERIIWRSLDGEVTHPRTQQPASLIVPTTGLLKVAADQDRVSTLADWITSSENPFFARVAVNRIWARCFGRGIVDPVDDFRESNPPAHPELLDRLADGFIQSGFDTKRVLRLILASRVYQLSSRTNEFNVNDDRYFSHYNARMLRAEQLLDAISQVTGVPERFAGLPVGTRATQLPSPDVGSDFLTVFGQPSRNTACDCERATEPKLTQALNLINGDEILAKLRNSSSRLSSKLDQLPSRLARAGTPPQSGLVLWLRADRGVISTDGGPAFNQSPVAKWVNQAATKDSADVGQTVVSQRPLFVTSAAGALPAVRFDGTDDWLNNTTTNLVASGSPRTVLVVGKSGDTGGSMLTFRRSTGGPQNGTVFTAQLGLHGGKFYAYSDGVNAAGNAAVPSEVSTMTQQPFVTTFVSPGLGGKLAVRLNGQSLRVEQAGGVGPDAGATGFTIGAREDYAGFRWDGDISEVLVYSRVLSSDELKQAGSYLATKYAIATSWPIRPDPPTTAAGPKDAEIIREIYLSALSRYPSPRELSFLEKHVAEVGNRRHGLEDIYWAVFNAKEFIFQH